MPSVILDASLPQSIERAARQLADGGLVALPTETVYGLAADAGNDAAIGAIFATKGRPADHPLIVHEADRDTAHAFAADWPPFAEQLAKAFWPGPLTLILPRRPAAAGAAAAGLDTIGLRCPRHAAALALLAACAKLGVQGLAAPSANRFGKVSPTSAVHVAAEFPDDDVLVLDGGPCEVGIESAILDCTRGAPVLLRPGVLGAAALEAAAGLRLRGPDELASAAPRAPGTLAVHYAPQARLRLMNARALQTALDLLGSELDATESRIAVYARSALKCRSSHGVLLRRMPDEPQAAAQQLFAALRAFDTAGVRLIWVEPPPETPDWDGVRDRLLRAAAS